LENVSAYYTAESYKYRKLYTVCSIACHSMLQFEKHCEISV